MEETETEGEPGGKEVRGQQGGGDRGAQEEGGEAGAVPGERWGRVWPPVMRCRGWRPTPPVSRRAGRDAEMRDKICHHNDPHELICPHDDPGE